ncbi:MAG: PEP-CTERM sorting domain-containing protein [Deltaproteobacteria bacterium]|nr:PEP-CTERM sorting domain-containing protein [Deltaproteobacteria bacterium]
MSKNFVLLLSLLLILAMAGLSSATVIVSGDFSLNCPGEYTTYYDPGGYFGNYYEYNFDTGSSTTPENFYLNTDNPVRQGSGVYNKSSVSGSFNNDTGAETFEFSAVSPDPGVVKAFVYVDLYAYAYFTGTLENFGYTYSFMAQKDDPADFLQLLIQMEISYYDTDINDYVVVYSDYGQGNLRDENYRTKWVQLLNLGSGSGGGTIEFDYSIYEEKDWQVRWDVMPYGADTAGSGQTTVPEPATILLVGFGLLGIAGLRRKF